MRYAATLCHAADSAMPLLSHARHAFDDALSLAVYADAATCAVIHAHTRAHAIRSRAAAKHDAARLMRARSEGAVMRESSTYE